jgi:predicted nicotinamide N-methyase
LLDFEAKVIDPLNEAAIVVSVGDPHRAAVERKVFKVVEWYRTESDLREQGMEPLLTVIELWNDFRRVRMAS